MVIRSYARRFSMSIRNDYAHFIDARSRLESFIASDAWCRACQLLAPDASISLTVFGRRFALSLSCNELFPTMAGRIFTRFYSQRPEGKFAPCAYVLYAEIILALQELIASKLARTEHGSDTHRQLVLYTRMYFGYFQNEIAHAGKYRNGQKNEKSVYIFPGRGLRANLFRLLVAYT